MPTMNVSVTPEQSRLIAREVESGHYASASEVVREALRVWREKQTEKDLAALEKAHAGAYDRDTNAEEISAILGIQKSVQTDLKRGRRK
jgi:putative addiction module CopG family antidote